MPAITVMALQCSTCESIVTVSCLRVNFQVDKVVLVPTEILQYTGWKLNMNGTDVVCDVCARLHGWEG